MEIKRKPYGVSIIRAVGDERFDCLPFSRSFIVCSKMSFIVIRKTLSLNFVFVTETSPTSFFGFIFVFSFLFCECVYVQQLFSLDGAM